MRKTTVTIDGGFLSRVYSGPDPAGFAQFLGRAAVDPDALVLTTGPDSLGLVSLSQSTFELGLMCWGHHLVGDWRLFRWSMDWAKRRGADTFVYPISVEQANAAQLGRIITRRYGFQPYQHLYVRRF
jgi:hypothetical protein